MSYIDFLVSKVRSGSLFGSGTIIPDPDLHHCHGLLLLIILSLPVADDRHQAEIGQLLILVQRPVLPLQAVLRIRDVYPGS
jgi:hypothetical protein